jgi:MazG family protein
MQNPEYDHLKGIIERLRDPEKGCPWDLKQTHKSLLKYLLEESYEFIHAVESKDIDHMEEELGDILLQVLLHATIGQQNGQFSMESICRKLAEKMVHRHPHVFKESREGITEQEVLANWDELKNSEKGKPTRELDESYLFLPSLQSAMKIGQKTHKIGFDWDDPSQVAYKVEEEWQELKEEVLPVPSNQQRIHEEFGDFLFSIVQLARHINIDPEEALRFANRKFLKRFNKMEDLIKESKKVFTDLNQKEMDVFWDKAKLLERKNET